MIQKFHRHYIQYELKYYSGSLDFPCAFCNRNSYRNFQLTIGKEHHISICEDCLKKVKEQDVIKRVKP